MSRKAAQKTQLAHSLAKVQFYQTFLNKYLRMLLSMPNIDEVNIYAVFCGRGVYENGTEGSSLRALSIVNSILEEKKDREYDYSQLKGLEAIGEDVTSSLEVVVEEDKRESMI